MRPTVSNKRSAKATCSSRAAAPRQSTIMPLPTAHGVFGEDILNLVEIGE